MDKVNLSFNEISLGDVFVIKDKTKVSYGTFQELLEENVPYSVEEIWSEHDQFWTINKGKRCIFFKSDMKYLEFIYMKNWKNTNSYHKELSDFKFGDKVIIRNIEGIEGASMLGFKQGEEYPVIDKNDVSITLFKEDGTELYVLENELSALIDVKEYVESESERLINELEKMNIENETNRLLKERNYKSLHKLNKYMKG